MHKNSHIIRIDMGMEKRLLGFGKEVDTVSRVTVRAIFHLLFSPDSCNSWAWTWPELGAWNPMWNLI